MVRLDELEEEKLSAISASSTAPRDELAALLELLSLAARIEGGRYEPVIREADSLELAPAGRHRHRCDGHGRPRRRSSARSRRSSSAAARHGGAEVNVTVDGPEGVFEPVAESAAPIVLGEEQRDLGAAVAVMFIRALGGQVALDGERLTVTLPTN